MAVHDLLIGGEERRAALVTHLLRIFCRQTENDCYSLLDSCRWFNMAQAWNRRTRIVAVDPWVEHGSSVE